MPYIIPSSAVNPGTVYQPRSRYILNRIGGAVAAWSTRRLISSAPADIARGRDASTNEEDFTATELAGTGFTTLAGAGDGFYVTLYDQIGNNNATQATAASQPKGVSTGTLIMDGNVPVLYFDGVDDALKVNDNSAFDFTNQLTISVWAKNNNPTLSSSQWILSKYDPSSNKREFALYIDAAEKLNFPLGDPSDGTLESVSGSVSAISIGNWNHLAATFNSGNVNLYVNGGSVNITNSATPPLTLFNSDADFYIGSLFNSGSISQVWDGEIRDPIIFNRALSASEISQLHTALS